MTSSEESILHMAVVIPARNEEHLLGRCLRSVRTAMDHVGVPVLVIVVLDSCTDSSADAARRWAQHIPLSVTEGTFGSVGAARDAGVLAARQCMPRAASERVWIANTDADSTVPAFWLERQQHLADSGIDLVLGTVEPGPPARGQELAHQLWFQQHELVEGHPHVHGANLGIRLSELDRVGGFGDARVGEDASVARRIQQDHDRWLATDILRVVTSSRREGRAQHGFAEYLRGLDTALDDADVSE